MSRPDLALPGGAAPSNLVLPRDTRTRMIDSDMYGICERIKEVSPNLYIVVHENPDGSLMHFSIMENCADGVQRLAFNVGPGQRCRFDALDNRVIEHLRYLRAVPVEQRLKEHEKFEKQVAAEQREYELEKLYEDMGRRMHHQLERDGFIEHRGVSYAKRGVKPTKA